VATIGAFVIAASVLVFLYNALVVAPKSPPASADPWDGRTLEWSIPSPPPEYNFATIPTVHSLDDYWHQKYTENEEGRLVRLPHYEAVRASSDTNVAPHGEPVHMPSPSYFPIVAAFGLLLIAYGMILGRSSGANYLVSFIGVLVLFLGLYGWGLEPSAEPHEPGDGHEPEEQPALVAAGVGAAGALESGSGSGDGESGPAGESGSAEESAGGEERGDSSTEGDTE
jgi:cytochrome c oxidase subunit I